MEAAHCPLCHHNHLQYRRCCPVGIYSYRRRFVNGLMASCRGWDQTGSNGANLSFPYVFGIGSKEGSDPWIVGLVNSAPYIGSAFVGIAGHMMAFSTGPKCKWDLWCHTVL